MAFKTGFVVMAPDGDPVKHRASIKTSKLELTTVVVPLMDFDRAFKVCRDLVEKESIQSLILCPGFTSSAVSMMANAVGEGVPVHVVRGDVPSVIAISGILAQEGWF